MQTIDRTSQACCAVGTVSILTNAGSHAVINMLVARERLLGYDLLIRKNMVVLSKLIWQMVMYLHGGSYIKPRRVKMRMPTKTGRKGYKKNAWGSAMTNFIFSLLSLQYFALDQNLLEEKLSSVERDREKRTTEYRKEVFLQTLRDFCRWETWQQLYLAYLLYHFPGFLYAWDPTEYHRLAMVHGGDFLSKLDHEMIINLCF